jgi:hypothetical protein
MRELLIRVVRDALDDGMAMSEVLDAVSTAVMAWEQNQADMEGEG